MPVSLQGQCVSITSRTEELTQSLSIRAEATAVRTKFNSLFTMYSKIHKLISHAHPVNGQQLTVIHDHIDECLVYYGGIFPGVVPWMREWEFGLGLHGEQGGKSIYAQFNEITANSGGIMSSKMHYFCPYKII